MVRCRTPGVTWEVMHILVRTSMTSHHGWSMEALSSWPQLYSMVSSGILIFVADNMFCVCQAIFVITYSAEHMETILECFGTVRHRFCKPAMIFLWNEVEEWWFLNRGQDYQYAVSYRYRRSSSLVWIVDGNYAVRNVYWPSEFNISHIFYLFGIERYTKTYLTIGTLRSSLRIYFSNIIHYQNTIKML